MKFRTKLAVGNGIVLVLVIIISIVLYQSINILDKTARWVNHTQAVIAKGNSLISAMIDQETGMRGYMVTGNDEFLEPYHAGKENFKAVIANLKQTVSDNPEQVARLGEIEKLAADWDKNAANVQIEKRKAVVKGETTFNDLI
ncbi:MAG: chemotaxis protein, partial [bacterium]|nr:chemotaxis protein [bacterium]